jgi:integrase
VAVRKRTWETESGETHSAWVVTYRDSERRQRQETFARKRDAKAREAEITENLKRGVHRPESTSITIKEAGALLIERAEGDRLEPNVVENYRRELRLHIEPALAPRDAPGRWDGRLGDLKLSKLTAPMCETFKRALVKMHAHDRAGNILENQTISRSTAKGVLTRFRAILKEAQVRGLIAYNPAQGVSIKTNDRDQMPLRIGIEIPDRTDIKAILLATTGHWHVLFLVAAFTGMRSSELRALPWPNVDLDGHVIHVWQRANTQGAIGKCKTGSGYRDIHIPEIVVDELRRWKVVCPISPQKLVFPSEAGNVRRHSSILRDGWFSLQHRIGMERADGKPKYKFHALRHFCASLMIDQGVAPKRLQALLGHAKISITMDTYGHLFPQNKDETARIDSAIASVLAAE